MIDCTQISLSDQPLYLSCVCLSLCTAHPPCPAVHWGTSVRVKQRGVRGSGVAVCWRTAAGLDRGTCTRPRMDRMWREWKHNLGTEKGKGVSGVRGKNKSGER